MNLSIKKYSFMLLSLVFMQACDNNFDEINKDPNVVAVPNAKYIFSKALFDGTRISGNTSALLLGAMQYTTSYNDVAGFGSKYVHGSGAVQSAGVFSDAYPNQINEIGEVIKAVKDDPSQVNLYAVARIWKVFCFSRLTDLYGDIPYTEAGQGYNQLIFQPTYDAQADIYADLLKELDEATQSLDAGNTNTYGSSDLIYGGNPAQWKKFGFSLMLRLGMRLTEVNEGSAQSWVTKAIAGGVIMDYADIAKVTYKGAGDDNPLARGMLNSDYGKADGFSNTEGGKYQQVFIDSLKANNDPRLSVISVVYVNGVADPTPAIQKGMASNINGVKPADFVTYSEPKQTTVLRVAAPMLLFTNTETYFLLAEAAVRNWYSAEPAAALYEKGIRAAMKQWDLISGVNGTITDAQINDYVATHQLTATTEEGQKEQIYTQFWVGLFPDAQEVFNNYRRTGYPALVPNNYPGNLTNGQLFKRFLYPVSEQNLNTASYNEAIARQGADTYLTPIWWDAK
jgi:hypothetical protein